ncbi:ABC transporter ATP-binding protein/permease [Patescibacteria group bacterium]|nr:ABC transporter ATP-binding protein/permease [Patescibacteria group bacterium]MBU2258994.1 ABC transporter ATP-binding protein/permease [Patescibacteria group bacterium]
MSFQIPNRLHRAQETFAVSKRLTGMIWDMDKRLFLGAVVSALVPSIIPFVNAYIYKLVIDAIIVGLSDPMAIDMQHFVALLVARIVTYFLQDAAFSTQGYVERLLWTKFPIYFNKRLFGHIAKLDIERFEDPAFRDRLEQVRDSWYRPQNLITGLLFALQSLFQFLIAFIAMLTLNWMLVLPIALIAVPEFLYRLYESQSSWSIWDWHSPRKKRYSYLSHLLQNAQSIKEMRIFRLAPLFVRETTQVQEDFYKDNKKLSTSAYIFRLIFNALSTVVFVGIEVYVIVLAFARRVTVGDIGFYTQVVSNFQNGLGGLLRNLNDVFEASLYVKSFFVIMDTPQSITSPKEARTTNFQSGPSITFEHVSFRYPGTQQDVLQDFCLTIQPKEKVAFVGENGAGKTTIIKLLARFYDPTSGRILVNGTDVRTLDLENWHRQLAILFQDFNRYEDTAKNNIYFGNVLKSMDMEEIEHAASDAGAKAVIDTLEKGYEQIIGRMFESGTELSVGQWQKIALARAYYRNAPVLILDEPTAAIDAKAETEIFERVEELCREKTLFLISHRFSTVRMADHIVVIDKGHVLEQGSHDELMANGGLYAELFGLQARGYR